MTAAVRPISERVAALDTLHLDRGHHRSWADGHCAMEAVAWLAGEGMTDAPSCASPVLTAYLVTLNDAWSDGQRQKLRPYLPRVVGTRGDGQDEARSYLALDWLIRVHTPAWMDLAGLADDASALRTLAPIVDLDTTQAAGPAVRAAQSSAFAARAGGEAAWEAAWAAARAAAWAPAEAAWDAAWAAAEAAWGADSAARDAAEAAWDAAWAAAEAARAAVGTLQASALDLLDRMIDPAAVNS